MKKRKFHKILSLVLTFAFVGNIIGIDTQSNSMQAAETAVELAWDLALPIEEAHEAIDLGVLRDSNHERRLYALETDDELESIIFANDDSTNTVYMFGEPVRYIDENGNARDKSNKLYADESGKYAFFNRENDIRTYFPKTLNSENGVLLTHDDINIELLPISKNTAKAEKVDKNQSREKSEIGSLADDWVYSQGY